VGDVMAAVIAKTAAAAGVSALVGSRVAPFADHASADAAGLPYITLQQVAGDDIDHLTGHSGKADAVLQINCVGATYASAQAVRNAVAAAWRAFNRGTVSTSAGDVRLHSATLEGQQDSPRAPAAGRDAPRFVNTIDLRVHVST
jgi:hypothetical protein